MLQHCLLSYLKLGRKNVNHTSYQNKFHFWGVRVIGKRNVSSSDVIFSKKFWRQLQAIKAIGENKGTVWINPI